jgi:WD40 repeat protein
MVLKTFGARFHKVIKVGFLPDSKRLVSVSLDWTVKIWDSNTGAILTTIEAGANSSSFVALSQDGKLLAVVTEKSVCIWDLCSGILQRTLDNPEQKRIADAVFSLDNKLLASTSWDGTIQLWNVSSGRIVQVLGNHFCALNHVVFSPDGKLLASTHKDGTVKLWNCDSGALVRTLEGHTQWISSVVFLPGGKSVVSSSADHTIKLWDAQSGAILQTLQFDVAVNSFSLANDGTILQTNRGQMHISYLSSSTASSRPSLTPSLFITKHWIVKDGKRSLWLLPEYRPRYIATYGSLVCLGCASGRVLFVETDVSR